MKTLVSGEFWEFCYLILSINRLIVTVNILLTLWLLVFRAADHESETILFHLDQGFSYLSCVKEYQNWEETTPKISIFKALENRQIAAYSDAATKSVQ